MELDLVRIIDITGVGLADGVRLGLLLGTLLGALVWPILGHSQRVMQWVVVGLLGGGGVRLLTVLPFFVSNTQSSLETAVANPDLSVVMMGSAVVDLIAAVAVAAGLGALLMIVLAEIRRALVGAALGFFIGPGVGILLIIAWASHPVLPLAWLPVLVGAALVPLFLLLATHIDVRAGR